MTTFQTILTNYGLQRMAQAESSGATINLVAMAVGDGNGNPTTPSPTQTQLVRETYRHAINRVYPDPTNPLLFTAELVIPASEGGFTIREAAVFDDTNQLFAVANTPDAYKPQGDGSEGAFGDTVLRMQFMVTNANIVTLQIDPNVAVASQSWVIGTITLPFLLKGGTTGQVLSKHSNADGDVVWVDAAAAVDVIVDSIVEIQTLAAGQTVVNLATITTTGSGIYVEGARLIEVADFTINSTTRFTLARSYPAGARIHMYQNDPTSQISDATETQHGFIKLATAAEATAGTDDTHAMTPLKVRQATPGRVLRTLVYSRGAGNVQQVSINGGTPTTVGATAYTPSAGMEFCECDVQGGGGAGGGANNPAPGSVSLGSPGKCGAYGKSIFTAAQVGASQIISVGAGGAAAAGGTGATGGTSSIGALLSSPGGTGGSIFDNVTAPVVNGNGGLTSPPSGANVISLPGLALTPSTAIMASLGAMWGGVGGRSHLGVGTSQNVGNANGLPGVLNGDGGGGVALIAGGGIAAGGIGASGIIIIVERS